MSHIDPPSTPTVSQPSAMPTRKMSAVGLSIPLSIIIVWAWNAFLPSILMPGEVGAAFGGIFAFVLGYMTKEWA